MKSRVLIEAAPQDESVREKRDGEKREKRDGYIFVLGWSGRRAGALGRRSVHVSLDFPSPRLLLFAPLR